MKSSLVVLVPWLLMTAACFKDPAVAVDASTDAPEIDAPAIDAPVIDAPVIDAPVIDAPVIDAPDAPAIDAPPVDAPPVDVAVDAATDAPADAAPITWQSPALVEQIINGNAISPSVDQNPDGTAIVVWVQDDGDRTLWYNTFSPASGWADARQIGTTVTAYTPRVSLQPNGHAVAVWFDVVGGTDYVPRTASYSPGQGWSGIQNIGASYPLGMGPGGPLPPPSLAFAASDAGRVVVAWEAKAAIAGDARIHRATYSPSSGWSPYVEIGPWPATSPQVTVDGMGMGAMTFTANQACNLIREIPAFGWTAPLDVGAMPDEIGSLICVDDVSASAVGHLALIAHESANPGPGVAVRAKELTAAWGATADLQTSATRGLPTRIWMADDDDGTAALWNDPDTGTAWFGLRTQGQWSSSMIGAGHPFVTARRYGLDHPRAVLAATTPAGAATVSRWDGAQWRLDEAPLAGSASCPGAIALDLSSESRGIAVWAANTTGGWCDLYARELR